VKQDLRPYVCLMPNCAKPYETFSETRDWLRHMEPEHKKNIVRWTCNAAKHNSPQIFHSSGQFEDHMRQDHPKVFTKSQHSIITKRSGGPAAQMFTCCPLCRWAPDVNIAHESLGRKSSTKTLETSGATQNSEAIMAKAKVELNSHIAEHLQFIALRSLPEEIYRHKTDSIRSRSSSPSSTEGGRSNLDINQSEIEFLQSAADASREDLAIVEEPVRVISPTEDQESNESRPNSRDKHWGRVFYQLARDPDLPKACMCISKPVPSAFFPLPKILILASDIHSHMSFSRERVIRRSPTFVPATVESRPAV
jgi:hypothetical protein